MYYHMPYRDISIFSFQLFNLTNLETFPGDVNPERTENQGEVRIIRIAEAIIHIPDGLYLVIHCSFSRQTREITIGIYLVDL